MEPNLYELTWELPNHPVAELCLYIPEEITCFPSVQASTATHPFPRVYAVFMVLQAAQYLLSSTETLHTVSQDPR